MIYSEDYKQAQAQEKALSAKWQKVLNAFGGISNEHMARTTAILLENYINHVNSDARLIAEDKIGTGAFTGVNLALINLIRRAIPELVGAELVGVQAMPTPASPVFTLKWKRDNTKGSVTAGQEIWDPTLLTQEDPYYSSSLVKSSSIADVTAGGTAVLTWAALGNNGNPVTVANFPITIVNNSMAVFVRSSAGAIVGTGYFASSNNYTTAVYTHVSGIDYFNGAGATATWTNGTKTVALTAETGAPAGLSATIEFEYVAESQPHVPELSLEVTRANVSVIRRQLRGRFSVDAAYDAKVLNGLVLENELMEMMKIELMNGINREIVDDLRLLAGNTYTVDVTAIPGTANTNYDDIAKYLLDAISRVSATIWTKGRLGYGNFIVGNPITLAFLDRVPGFIGSGVNADGKGLTFAGSLGGRIKFYKDPQYPENELLIGYKGSSTLDTGYMHCPYLPITAMPTMHDQLTGDPIKHFYTRYGKTFRAFDPETQARSQVILNAENQYAILKIDNMPALFT